jgi:hypothetical protein
VFGAAAGVYWLIEPLVVSGAGVLTGVLDVIEGI